MQLKVIARAKDRSLAYIVRQAIKQYLERRAGNGISNFDGQ